MRDCIGAKRCTYDRDRAEGQINCLHPNANPEDMKILQNLEESSYKFFRGLYRHVKGYQTGWGAEELDNSYFRLVLGTFGKAFWLRCCLDDIFGAESSSVLSLCEEEISRSKINDDIIWTVGNVVRQRLFFLEGKEVVHYAMERFKHVSPGPKTVQ